MRAFWGYEISDLVFFWGGGGREGGTSGSSILCQTICQTNMVYTLHVGRQAQAFAFLIREGFSPTSGMQGHDVP